MPDRPHVCVFCGSRAGVDPAHADAARRVGRAMARLGLGLVYGGGRVGLMGILADAALGEGGQVVGVIPEALAIREVAHAGLTELHVVPGMHERKALMSTRADAFLTLPGGVGTFEEFFELLSWGVLGLHRKPMGVLNIRGYYGPLLGLLRHAVESGFSDRTHLDLLLIGDEPEALVASILAHRPAPIGPKWIGLEDT